MKQRTALMSPRLVRLLILLAQGPKYSGDFIRIDPANFTQERKTNGAANIYMLLRRAKDAGLVEDMPETFIPPVAEGEEINGMHMMRTYYQLSAKGRAALRKAQSMMADVE